MDSGIARVLIADPFAGGSLLPSSLADQCSGGFAAACLGVRLDGLVTYALCLIRLKSKLLFASEAMREALWMER